MLEERGRGNHRCMPDTNPRKSPFLHVQQVKRWFLVNERLQFIVLERDRTPLRIRACRNRKETEAIGKIDVCGLLRPRVVDGNFWLTPSSDYEVTGNNKSVNGDA